MRLFVFQHVFLLKIVILKTPSGASKRVQINLRRAYLDPLGLAGPPRIDPRGSKNDQKSTKNRLFLTRPLKYPGSEKSTTSVFKEKRKNVKKVLKSF